MGKLLELKGDLMKKESRMKIRKRKMRLKAQ